MCLKTKDKSSCLLCACFTCYIVITSLVQKFSKLCNSQHLGFCLWSLCPYLELIVYAVCIVFIYDHHDLI